MSNTHPHFSAVCITSNIANEDRPRKILSAIMYKEICEFINNYHGLAIDCELEMLKLFTQINRMTLKSILQSELGTRLRSQHWRYEAKASKHLKIFSEQSTNSPEATLLIKLANMEGMSPVFLARSILQEKYKYKQKSDVTRLLRYPHFIDDPRLAANVAQCLISDNQDGPLVDLKRRILGEEYEFKLKNMAKSVGMHYYDENDLRRMGFDKTPDLKLILPCLYKGEVVNWIESKATFGDIKMHEWNMQQQLISYCNRFGPGIVIYWFGYHEETPSLSKNSHGIIVLADFPAKEDLTFLHLNSDDIADCSEKTSAFPLPESLTDDATKGTRLEDKVIEN